jgi:hypothetical protein
LEKKVLETWVVLLGEESGKGGRKPPSHPELHVEEWLVGGYGVSEKGEKQWST